MSSKGYLYEDNNGNGVIPSTGALIFASSYSPTASATSNLDATPTMTGRYMRIGTRVHVSGTAICNPTAGGATSFEIDLPIASNLGVFSDASGAIIINGAVGTESGTILAEPTNNTLKVEWQATNTVNQTYTWWADYDII